MKYFRILDDLAIKKRWFLGSINFESSDTFWEYIKANTVLNYPDNLKIEINQFGKKMDWTFADFELIIVNDTVAHLFNDDEVQKIPITVDGEVDNYYVLVIKNEIDPIDKEKSIFQLWEKGNSIRPDLAGEYQHFIKIVVDSKKIDGNNIFRIKGFDVAIIVSETIKFSFEKAKLKGIEFVEV